MSFLQQHSSFDTSTEQSDENENENESENKIVSNSNALALCIDQMVHKRIELTTTIQQDEDSLEQLIEQIKELNGKEKKLRKKIELNKKNKSELENTISETKNGYQRIVEATNTLMEIITQQHLPKFNINNNE